jgi:hypothetical protein
VARTLAQISPGTGFALAVSTFVLASALSNSKLSAHAAKR